MQGRKQASRMKTKEATLHFRYPGWKVVPGLRTEMGFMAAATSEISEQGSPQHLK